MIIISKLPLSIQRKLPYSIRSYKDEYELDELPYNIQYMLEDYIDNPNSKNDKNVLDYDGKIAEITTLSDLVVEYVKNYFKTEEGTYPYDCTWGCKLKRNLHKLDTPLRGKLISNEISKLTRAISTDLDVNIKIEELKMNKGTSDGFNIEYNYLIKLNVGGVIKDMSITYT